MLSAAVRLTKAAAVARPIASALRLARYVSVDASELRPGNVVEKKGKLYEVLKTHHAGYGRGSSYNVCDLRDIVSGARHQERFKTDMSVERVALEERKLQFLYREGETIHLMDVKTFEQIEIPVSVIGDSAPYLQESMELFLSYHKEKPVVARLPEIANYKIVEAEAAVKGSQVAPTYKEAILENGRKIMVPPFVEAGTMVRVRIADEQYVDRA
eukprot:tig00001130_g7236.t1